MKELGESLSILRKESGVSLEEASNDLGITAKELESLENGNFKVFKDVYELKKIMRNYAKYLGIDENEIIDEFNDFLFEKTSKISLDDIKEAQKKVDNEKKKISSPYTNQEKKKIAIWPFALGIGIIILVCLIVYIIFVNVTSKTPVRVDELFLINERI